MSTQKKYGRKDRKPSAKQIALIGRLIAEDQGITWPTNSRDGSKLYCQLAQLEDQGWGSEERDMTPKQFYGITRLLLKKTRRKWPTDSANASEVIQRLQKKVKS
jgi:hypothetical protein